MAIRTRELSEQEAFEIYFQDLMLERRIAMPATITKINTTDGGLSSVDVQPAIKQSIASDDGLSSTSEDLPAITQVPVVFPYSTTLGYSMTLPIGVGDECLLVICDRSIDNWQDFGGTQAVAETVTPRSHDLTDAVCIPGIFSKQNKIDNWSSDTIDIRNASADTCISLKDSEITVKTPDATIGLSSAGVSITATQIDLVGDVTVTGNFDLTGTMTDSNGINIEDHVHSDPQGGKTGSPENP